MSNVIELDKATLKKIAEQKWVQVRIEIKGILVSIIENEWFDNIDVTLSARPLKDDDFTALDQALRYLGRLSFAPFQNIGKHKYEVAVPSAEKNLKRSIEKFKKEYADYINIDTPLLSASTAYDEFEIIITVKEA